METIFRRFAGLDAHKVSVEAHVRCWQEEEQLNQETRRWGRMMRDGGLFR